MLPALQRYLETVQPVLVKPPPIAFDWLTISAGDHIVSKDALGGDAGKKVNLSEYCIAKKPVTNAQYKLFVDATGRDEPYGWKDGNIPQGKEEKPVVNITWTDATAFCKWASKEMKQGVRLPTEVEWERAMLQLDMAAIVLEWTDTPYRSEWHVAMRREGNSASRRWRDRKFGKSVRRGIRVVCVPISR